MYIVGGGGTIASWPLMQVAGRRTLYLWGQAAMAGIMLITGILGSAAKHAVGAQYAVRATLLHPNVTHTL
jgi:SP family general alpha glucoside:H+ symporter-like MFS transporter